MGCTGSTSVAPPSKALNTPDSTSAAPPSKALNTPDKPTLLSSSAETKPATDVSASANAKPATDVSAGVQAKPAPDVIRLLKNVFNQLDANGDGNISKDELSESFERLLDCSERQSRKSFRTLIADAGLNPYFYVFEQLDTNQDGKITWEEFEAQLHPTKAATNIKQMLKERFNQLDANGDGSISKVEFSASLERLLDCSEIKSEKSFRTLIVDAGLNPDFYVFEQLDTNQDGRITWEEFQAQLQPATDIMQLLKNVFNGLDANGDGNISKVELSNVLDCSERKSKKSFRALIMEAGLNPDSGVFEQLDTNQDGKITWEEFQSHLQSAKTAIAAYVAGTSSSQVDSDAKLEAATTATAPYVTDIPSQQDTKKPGVFDFLQCWA